MGRKFSISCSVWLVISIMLFALFSSPEAARADEFEQTLARVDKALKTNPTGAPLNLLETCRDRRQFAAELYTAGFTDRAVQRLTFCFDLLGVSPTPPAESNQISVAEVKKLREADAAREIEKALAFTPNIENGLEIYRGCAKCHKAEGWGLSSGSVPQVAGQHPKVVIKQVADVRAGNRDNAMMAPYVAAESIGSAQAIAHVASYIDTLDMSVDMRKGPGTDLALGEGFYVDNCARCHGAQGEGNEGAFVPRIHSQAYRYLVRQFGSIRDGKRGNANPEMLSQIQGFQDGEGRASLDYVSRIEPPAELQAPPGWKNPDFAGPMREH